ATIDPFEQLKKATDSKIKNLVVEFHTANVRYYTTHSALPWRDMQGTNTLCTNVGSTSKTALKIGTGAIYTNCIGSSSLSNSLIGDGELKSGFSDAKNDLNNIYLTWNSNDAANLVVCFSPISKSQKALAETKYTVADGVTTDPTKCPNANAADGVCFWCTK
ncbi:hypothetical protein KKG52_01460, partial [Patescibacteria group bacterium]|nr:hypothetical protein [Patescibacteria group bacterium]